MPRARCNVCCNAVMSCICKWTSPIFNQTNIVLLQHSDEVKKPLGTAKIVSLCLQNALVKVGVDFSTDVDFDRLMNFPNQNLAMLYPSESALELHSWRNRKPDTEEEKQTETVPKTLIVLDGTWRNTREIMNVNPALKNLPAVKLTPTIQSNYRIRKAPFADSLSTVEAVSQALNILEPETSVDAMSLSFQHMIDYQINRMGEDVYLRNYVQPPSLQD